MPDEASAVLAGGDDLVLKAMLYASGELDAGEAEAFEQRLGEDQAARDALCRAVELTQALAPATPAVPDPAYRSRVRHRLRQRRRHRMALSQSPSSLLYHPAIWSILGAAIAVLLIVLVSQIIAHLDGSSSPRPVQMPTTAPTADGSLPSGMASAWADLNKSDHLDKARTEEMGRRLRNADRPQLRPGLVLGVDELVP